MIITYSLGIQFVNQKLVFDGLMILRVKKTAGRQNFPHPLLFLQCVLSCFSFDRFILDLVLK